MTLEEYLDAQRNGPRTPTREELLAQRRATQLEARRRRGIGPPERRFAELTIGALVRLEGYPNATAWGTAHNVSGSTLKTYRDEGMTIHAADRHAVAGGFHPATVWGDAWWRALELVDEQLEHAS
jgi:hypothetical protein